MEQSDSYAGTFQRKKAYEVQQASAAQTLTHTLKSTENDIGDGRDRDSWSRGRRQQPPVPVSLSAILRLHPSLGTPERINAASKCITVLDSVSARLAGATVVYLSGNGLSSLDGPDGGAGILQFGAVHTLSLSHNNLDCWRDVHTLSLLPRLAHLRLEGNPIASSPLYRTRVIAILAATGVLLQTLDGIPIGHAERHAAQSIAAWYCAVLCQLLSSEIRIHRLAVIVKMAAVHEELLDKRWAGALAATRAGQRHRHASLPPRTRLHSSSVRAVPSSRLALSGRLDGHGRDFVGMAHSGGHRTHGLRLPAARGALPELPVPDLLRILRYWDEGHPLDTLSHVYPHVGGGHHALCTPPDAPWHSTDSSIGGPLLSSLTRLVERRAREYLPHLPAGSAATSVQAPAAVPDDSAAAGSASVPAAHRSSPARTTPSRPSGDTALFHLSHAQRLKGLLGGGTAGEDPRGVASHRAAAGSAGTVQPQQQLLLPQGHLSAAVLAATAQGGRPDTSGLPSALAWEVSSWSQGCSALAGAQAAVVQELHGLIVVAQAKARDTALRIGGKDAHGLLANESDAVDSRHHEGVDRSSRVAADLVSSIQEARGGASTVMGDRLYRTVGHVRPPSAPPSIGTGSRGGVSIGAGPGRVSVEVQATSSARPGRPRSPSAAVEDHAAGGRTAAPHATPSRTTTRGAGLSTTTGHNRSTVRRGSVSFLGDSVSSTRPFGQAQPGLVAAAGTGMGIGRAGEGDAVQAQAVLYSARGGDSLRSARSLSPSAAAMRQAAGASGMSLAGLKPEASSGDHAGHRHTPMPTRMAAGSGHFAGAASSSSHGPAGAASGGHARTLHDMPGDEPQGLRRTYDRRLGVTNTSLPEATQRSQSAGRAMSMSRGSKRAGDASGVVNDFSATGVVPVGPPVPASAARSLSRDQVRDVISRSNAVLVAMRQARLKALAVASPPAAGIPTTIASPAAVVMDGRTPGRGGPTASGSHRRDLQPVGSTIAGRVVHSPATSSVISTVSSDAGHPQQQGGYDVEGSALNRYVLSGRQMPAVGMHGGPAGRLDISATGSAPRLNASAMSVHDKHAEAWVRSLVPQLHVQQASAAAGQEPAQMHGMAGTAAGSRTTAAAAPPVFDVAVSKVLQRILSPPKQQKAVTSGRDAQAGAVDTTKAADGSVATVLERPVFTSPEARAVLQAPLLTTGTAAGPQQHPEAGAGAAVTAQGPAVAPSVLPAPFPAATTAPTSASGAARPSETAAAFLNTAALTQQLSGLSHGALVQLAVSLSLKLKEYQTANEHNARVAADAILSAEGRAVDADRRAREATARADEASASVQQLQQQVEASKRQHEDLKGQILMLQAGLKSAEDDLTRLKQELSGGRPGVATAAAHTGVPSTPPAVPRSVSAVRSASRQPSPSASVAAQGRQYLHSGTGTGGGATGLAMPAPSPTSQRAATPMASHRTASPSAASAAGGPLASPSGLGIGAFTASHAAGGRHHPGAVFAYADWIFGSQAASPVAASGAGAAVPQALTPQAQAVLQVVYSAELASPSASAADGQWPAAADVAAAAAGAMQPHAHDDATGDDDAFGDISRDVLHDLAATAASTVARRTRHVQLKQAWSTWRRAHSVEQTGALLAGQHRAVLALQVLGKWKRALRERLEAVRADGLRSDGAPAGVPRGSPVAPSPSKRQLVAGAVPVTGVQSQLQAPAAPAPRRGSITGLGKGAGKAMPGAAGPAVGPGGAAVPAATPTNTSKTVEPADLGVTDLIDRFQQQLQARMQAQVRAQLCGQLERHAAAAGARRRSRSAASEPGGTAAGGVLSAIPAAAVAADGKILGAPWTYASGAVSAVPPATSSTATAAAVGPMVLPVPSGPLAPGELQGRAELLGLMERGRAERRGEVTAQRRAGSAGAGVRARSRSSGSRPHAVRQAVRKPAPGARLAANGRRAAAVAGHTADAPTDADHSMLQLSSDQEDSTGARSSADRTGVLGHTAGTVGRNVPLDAVVDLAQVAPGLRAAMGSTGSTALGSTSASSVGLLQASPAAADRQRQALDSSLTSELSLPDITFGSAEGAGEDIVDGGAEGAAEVGEGLGGTATGLMAYEVYGSDCTPAYNDTYQGQLHGVANTDSCRDASYRDAAYGDLTDDMDDGDDGGYGDSSGLRQYVGHAELAEGRAVSHTAQHLSASGLLPSVSALRGDGTLGATVSAAGPAPGQAVHMSHGQRRGSADVLFQPERPTMPTGVIAAQPATQATFQPSGDFKTQPLGDFNRITEDWKNSLRAAVASGGPSPVTATSGPGAGTGTGAAGVALSAAVPSSLPTAATTATVTVPAAGQSRARSRSASSVARGTDTRSRSNSAAGGNVGASAAAATGVTGGKVDSQPAVVVSRRGSRAQDTVAQTSGPVSGSGSSSASAAPIGAVSFNNTQGAVGSSGSTSSASMDHAGSSTSNVHGQAGPPRTIGIPRAGAQVVARQATAAGRGRAPFVTRSATGGVARGRPPGAR